MPDQPNNRDTNHVQHNAASKKQVREAKRAEHFRSQRERADLVELLELPAFRRFVWGLLSDCHMFESVWDPSARIHFNAGQQDVAQRLWAKIELAAPQAVLEMMIEGNREKANNG